MRTQQLRTELGRIWPKFNIVFLLFFFYFNLIHPFCLDCILTEEYCRMKKHVFLLKSIKKYWSRAQENASDNIKDIWTFMHFKYFIRNGKICKFYLRVFWWKLIIFLGYSDFTLCWLDFDCYHFNITSNNISHCWMSNDCLGAAVGCFDNLIEDLPIILLLLILLASKGKKNKYGANRSREMDLR